MYDGELLVFRCKYIYTSHEISLGDTSYDPAANLQVKKLQREGHLDAIVDRNLNSCYNGQEVEMMIQIALLCTQASPEDRPSMSEVVRMLEGEGLAERWEEWQQVEVTRRQDYERMQQRFDWGEDSIYNQDAIELSAGR